MNKYGQIHHIGDEIDGNKSFVKDGTITMELNMDSSPRTLTFFNQGKEQKNYVKGLPPAIRLWAYFLAVGAIFEVTQFERLDSPTAKHGPKSVGWRWGEQWDDPDF
ncbi:MAG: hypothetical protein EZS28_039610 [Streblomastix strix]|uniref:Uncharacterized protein n=1 Tax=Streblomastix strix TaxID=222440 RepID=A0A5J4U3A8_9EUKA|nr:MAG: hypothetical protein EZS28_039610 [Streblomastix strix]